MSLLQLQENLRQLVKQAAQEFFNIELEQFTAEVPPRTELGDLAFPIAFELAKRIKQNTGEKQNPRAESAPICSRVIAFSGWLRRIRYRNTSQIQADAGANASDLFPSRVCN